MSDGGSWSRRAVLRGAATGVALSVVPMGVSTVAGAAPRALPRPDPLKRSTFEPLIGRTFAMAEHGTTRQAVLAEVNDLSPSSKSGSEDQFALVFQTRRGGPAAGGIKRFQHDEIGSVDLFAGPVDLGRKALRFEAVINRR
jgi:hypothetical protein